MSQKVHPKGFRLRSTGPLNGAATLPDRIPSVSNSPNKPIKGAWDSVWFSEPKKGKHLYTRLLHEDQMIQDYTKGLFRSFGFYQQKCIIERKCNQELHITSYVLRTPKLQPSKIDVLSTRTRQEKILQEGLQQGWIPFLIKSVIAKILYDKSQTLKNENSAPFGASDDKYFKQSLRITLTNQDYKEKTKYLFQNKTIPSISAILAPQDNSKTQLLTNKKRFYELWNSWLFTNNKVMGIENTRSGAKTPSNTTFDRVPLESAKVPSIPSVSINAWWSHRSWSSILWIPSISNETASVGAPYGLLNEIKLTYSIQPTQSLVSSSQLIVDYIADKIEQSTPVGLIFNELLRFFETEALCLGPDFINNEIKEESNSPFGGIGVEAPNFVIEEKLGACGTRSGSEATQLSKKNTQTLGVRKQSFQSQKKENDLFIDSQRPKILGFRIVCSGRLQMSSFSKPAEKAESIEITRGVLPLNTFKANIDFAQTSATNAYGTCGIKVWVHRA